MAKSKYETHILPNLDLIKGWARDGLTDKQISENLKISIQSFYTYKEKHIEFFDALKESKEVADYAVENALYNNAINGNITAQIFWLKNRKPTKWRDKVETTTDDPKTALDKLVNAIKGVGNDNG